MIYAEQLKGFLHLLLHSISLKFGNSKIIKFAFFNNIRTVKWSKQDVTFAC